MVLKTNGSGPDRLNAIETSAAEATRMGPGM
jgi:hypothetical protein